MYSSLAELLKEYNLCIFIVNLSVILSSYNKLQVLKGTAMQIEKAQANDPLPVPKVSWNFSISTIHNSAVIYPWDLLFS